MDSGTVYNRKNGSTASAAAAEPVKKKGGKSAISPMLLYGLTTPHSPLSNSIRVAGVSQHITTAAPQWYHSSITVVYLVSTKNVA